MHARTHLHHLLYLHDSITSQIILSNFQEQLFRQLSSRGRLDIEEECPSSPPPQVGQPDTGAAWKAGTPGATQNDQDPDPLGGSSQPPASQAAVSLLFSPACACSVLSPFCQSSLSLPVIRFCKISPWKSFCQETVVWTQRSESHKWDKTLDVA